MSRFAPIAHLVTAHSIGNCSQVAMCPNPHASARVVGVRRIQRAGSAPPHETEAIRRASFADLRQMLARHGAKMILLDPQGTYSGLTDDAVAAGEMVYVGNKQWREEISLPSEELPLSERVVPYDGHYGRGVHALISDMVSERLRMIGLMPAK